MSSTEERLVSGCDHYATFASSSRKKLSRRCPEPVRDPRCCGPAGLSGPARLGPPSGPPPPGSKLRVDGRASPLGHAPAPFVHRTSGASAGHVRICVLFPWAAFTNVQAIGRPIIETPRPCQRFGKCFDFQQVTPALSPPENAGLCPLRLGQGGLRGRSSVCLSLGGSRLLIKRCFVDLALGNVSCFTSFRLVHFM